MITGIGKSLKYSFSAPAIMFMSGYILAEISALSPSGREPLLKQNNFYFSKGRPLKNRLRFRPSNLTKSLNPPPEHFWNILIRTYCQLSSVLMRSKSFQLLEGVDCSHLQYKLVNILTITAMHQHIYMFSTD